MSKFVLYGKEYDLEGLDEKCQHLVARLNALDARIKETENMRVLLTKAKRAYIADLKTEILANKAGFDFQED